jgi:hypothetical protein
MSSVVIPSRPANFSSSESCSLDPSKPRINFSAWWRVSQGEYVYSKERLVYNTWLPLTLSRYWSIIVINLEKLGQHCRKLGLGLRSNIYEWQGFIGTFLVWRLGTKEVDEVYRIYKEDHLIVSWTNTTCTITYNYQRFCASSRLRISILLSDYAFGALKDFFG